MVLRKFKNGGHIKPEQSVGSLKGDLSIETIFDLPEISPDSPFY
jgi:hypothetical protein